ncbi:MAG TPA: alpha/beta hydrolase [Acidocella sp.]|jgi:acetyl esterase|nr:alpha/beta hydrolase [Acidocella sp.]
MPVNPQFSMILPMLPQAIAMSRAIAEGKMAPLDIQPGMMGPVTKVAHVEDRALETAEGLVPLRIYTPRTDAKLPLVLFFHGGGFVSGDVNTHDELTRQLALAADAVVLSVSYRLAPAHPFPAALHDCLAALEWGVAHAAEIGADASRLAVAGDSAGGNLAAVVAQYLRDKGGVKLAAQLLIYPSTDFSGAPTGSMLESGEGFYISREDMEYYHESYIGGADAGDPYISPLKAKTLADLPPAFVLTAQYDPLRDQGQAYAKRLAEEGVPVEFVNYEDAIHGFLSFPVPLGKEAIEHCGVWLKARLG